MNAEKPRAGLAMTPVDGGPVLVEGYGNGGFRLRGTRIEGAVLLTVNDFQSFPLSTPEDLAAKQAALITQFAAGIEILLLGMGPMASPPPQAFEAALKQAGLSADWMDTGAAARTFNVLAAEARRVAALLLPV